MDVVIKRNSKLPVSMTRTFSTVKDFQRSVMLRILQGEREYAKVSSRHAFIGFRFATKFPQMLQ